VIGKTVSHFEILEKLGEGGMGIVYKARDTHLSRFVAIKVLPPEKIANPERKRRFVQEAKSASTLNHPNIITVYDIDHRNGLDFIAMEYVAGKPLQRMIPREGVAPEEVVKYAVQIVGALAAAHRAGIIHRDLKPSNIMVREDGLVKVLDFGLAKLVERQISESDATATEMVRTGREEIVGTAAYMSPEQVERRRLDARSDIFSFGAVLYEMLAGRRPFEGDSSIVVMAAVVQKEPKPLGESAVKVPPELAGVAARCLQKDPERRYQTAEELRAALESCERGAAKDPESFPSIAVLPFLNMSRDEEDEYFSDGLTEELINALTQVAGLRVVSRTSVFRYKGVAGDICKVGRKLRVGMALEGSVRRAKNRVRVTAQLVKVDDGYHVWSQRYDREMKDIFDLQDELARAIVETLEVKLVGDQKQQLVKARAVSPKAHELLLKGRYYFFKYTRKGFEQANEYFEKARMEDSENPLVYAWSASVRCETAIYGLAPPREVMPDAKREALRALELDDTVADAHQILATIRHFYEWDWPGAEREYQRAIELNPSDSAAYPHYAELLADTDRFDESIPQARQAVRLDPVSTDTNRALADMLWLARRYDEAIEQCHRTLEFSPDCWFAHLLLGAAHTIQGQWEEALRAVDQMRSLAPGEPACEGVAGWILASAGRRAEASRIVADLIERRSGAYFPATVIAWTYLGLGENDEVFKWLDIACDERDGTLCMMKANPASDPLRSDPRFVALLKKMGLEP
jgi:serine/threonine protein kinase/Tfp pilus assembly protein PilF